jgi:drug/metabolite transporter (DMT)-like permease
MIRPTSVTVDSSDEVNNDYNIDDTQQKKKTKKRQPRWWWFSCYHRTRQIVSIFVYLITWVANGEILQVMTSTGININGSTSRYNQPGAVTWFSYNFMTISLLLGVMMSKTSPHHSHDNVKIRDIIQKWAGRLGLKKAVSICIIISYLLLMLNMLMVLGLDCISVSLSNAIFQLQTPFTIILSAAWLKDQFQYIEGIGMILSMIGVTCIILPPLSHDDNNNHNNQSICQKGIIQTMISAAIGGFYLTSWRWLEKKNEPTTAISNIATILNSKEGFIDTHMTLGMIGICNFIFGWPVLVLLHYTGIEIFEWPSSQGIWNWLFLNGIVEYIFDASCAVAIFVTSPIIVSVTAPLTIPLSIIMDQSFRPNGSMIQFDISLFLGVILVVVGTILIEIRPKLKLRRVGRCFPFATKYTSETNDEGNDDNVVGDQQQFLV